MGRSPVAGVAGAVRLQRLDAAGLAAAEDHGKRKDYTSQMRRIRDAAPVTRFSGVLGNEGLEDDLALRDRYAEHVEGAKLHGGDTIALHAFVQFPTDLVRADEPHRMVQWAVSFGRSVFGEEAVFSARCDQDEIGQHGVDLFLAPIYYKKTKRNPEGVRAVSTTRHLKLLAEELGVVDDHNEDVLAKNAEIDPTLAELATRLDLSVVDVKTLRSKGDAVDEYNAAVKAWPETHPTVEKKGDRPRQLVLEGNLFLQGVALQTAFYRFLENEGLAGVQRGSPKRSKGNDWKSPEHFAALCELYELHAQIEAAQERKAQIEAEANAVNDKAVRDANKAADAVLAKAEADAKVMRDTAAREANKAADAVRIKAEADAKAVRDTAASDAKRATDAVLAKAEADAKVARDKATNDAEAVKAKAQADARVMRDAAAGELATAKTASDQAQKARDDAAADRTAAADELAAAKLDRQKAAEDAKGLREQAAAGVRIAIEQWLLKKVELAGNSAKPEWDWLDPSAGEKFSEVVKAAGRAAWMAVFELMMQIKRAVAAARAEQLEKAVTPEDRRQAALSMTTGADAVRMLAARTDQERERVAREVAARAPVAAGEPQMSEALRQALSAAGKLGPSPGGGRS